MKAKSLLLAALSMAAAPPALAQEKSAEKALLEQAIQAVNRAVDDQSAAREEVGRAVQQAEQSGARTSGAAGRLVDAGKELATSSQKEKDARALLKKAKERLGLPASPETAVLPPTGAPTAPARAKEELNTYIVGEDEAVYDSQSGVAIFEKNVRVIRADLRIWCDQLDVQLRVEEEGPADRPAAASAPASANATGMDTDNLKQAVAKSRDNLVVIWRRTADGEILATCREAIYDGATGNLILKRSPEVFKDRKIFIRGADDTAEITVLRDGRYTGRVSLATVRSATEARALRQRLLSHIPKKSGGDTADQDAGGSDAPASAAEAPADAPRAESQPLNNLPPLPRSGRTAQ